PSLDYRVAYTDDFARVCDSWDKLAIRQKNGTYHIEEMDGPIHRAVDLSQGADVITLSVSKNQAAYGLSIGPKEGRHPLVLAFDITATPPTLQWKKPGY